MDTEHGELARIIGDVRRAERERDAATERAERAERERDDLAATLETRTAEHALAMARVTELEARLEFADRGLKTLTDAGWELATERDRLRAEHAAALAAARREGAEEMRADVRRICAENIALVEGVMGMRDVSTTSGAVLCASDQSELRGIRRIAREVEALPLDAPGGAT